MGGAFSLRGLRDLHRIQLKKSPLPESMFAHIVFALGGQNTGKFQLNCDFIMKIFFRIGIKCRRLIIFVPAFGVVAKFVT